MNKRLINVCKTCVVVLILSYLYGVLSAGSFNVKEWDDETRHQLMENVPPIIFVIGVWTMFVQED